MDSNKKRKAFNISSLFIILFLLAIILIPITSGGTVKIDKEKVMFKKAYFATKRISSELISDTVLYPQSPELPGFKNNSPVTTQGGTIINETDSADTKFYKLFKEKLEGEEIGESTFKTQDGMEWKIPSEGSIETEAKLTVTPFPAEKPELTFDIYINYDGKINVKGDKETEYLMSQKLIQ